MRRITRRRALLLAAFLAGLALLAGSWTAITSTWDQGQNNRSQAAALDALTQAAIADPLGTGSSINDLRKQLPTSVDSVDFLTKVMSAGSSAGLDLTTGTVSSGAVRLPTLAGPVSVQTVSVSAEVTGTAAQVKAFTSAVTSRIPLTAVTAAALTTNPSGRLEGQLTITTYYVPPAASETTS